VSGFFPSGFPVKTLYTFLSSPVCPTCLTYLILLDLICLMILGDSTNYEAPPYATSPFSRYFIPLRSKYSPLHPVLKHPQSVLFP
jgi:hypothetical protein